LQPDVNERALTAAWVRVRTLAESEGTVDVDEVRTLELALRPLAGALEIQRGMVPLLDRAKLYGLAMAWDSDPTPPTPVWQLARIERWLALGAPEFAFIALAQMRAGGTPIDGPRVRAWTVLERERARRGALWQLNLAALNAVDPDLVQRLQIYPRMSVGLLPIGAGVAEFSSQGGSHLQLWAATPNEAGAEAEPLIARCAGRSDVFIAGVGDGTLPVLTLRTRDGNTAPLTVHVVEPNLARVRALFEIADVSAALREGRLWLHAGPRSVETLSALFARGQPLSDDAVLGGDPLALSILEMASGRRPVE
jgi:hypothetical protein